MKHYFSILCLALSCVFCNLAIADTYGLVGDTVDASVIRTIYDPFYGVGRINGYGLDSPFVVAQGNSDQKEYRGAFILNVDNLSFDVDFLSSNSWQDGIILRISDLNFSSNLFTSFSLQIQTNLSGLTWTQGSNFVDINLFSFHQEPISYIHGQFVITSIPEPSNLALLMIGFLCTVMLNKRRQSISNSTKLDTDGCSQKLA